MHEELEAAVAVQIRVGDMLGTRHASDAGGERRGESRELSMAYEMKGEHGA